MKSSAVKSRTAASPAAAAEGSPAAPPTANKQDGKSAGDGAAADAVAAKKPRRKIQRSVKETDVVGANGIWALYELSLNSGLTWEKDTMLSDLKKANSLMAVWAKELFPKGHRDDTLDRISQWGRTASVRAGLNSLRQVEAKRAVLGTRPDIKGMRTLAKLTAQEAEAAEERKKEKRRQAKEDRERELRGEDMDDLTRMAGRRRAREEDEDGEGDGEEDEEGGDMADGGPDRRPGEGGGAEEEEEEYVPRAAATHSNAATPATGVQQGAGAGEGEDMRDAWEQVAATTGQGPGPGQGQGPGPGPGQGQGGEAGAADEAELGMVEDEW